MGLAASQARFLGITARKSNIEYEGQQVNQQRTALAQEVNALYSKLLALDVPIAPDTTDFYETNYTFEVTNTSSSNGKYTIRNYFENEDGKTYTVIADNSYTKNVAVGTVLNTTTNKIEKDGENYKIYGIDDAPIVLTKMDEESSRSKIDLINASYPNTDGTPAIKGTYLYSYSTGTAENPVIHYIDAADVENPDLTEYSSYIRTEKDFTERQEFPNAVISFDDNGRMESINLDGKTNLEVGTTRMHDDEGYEKALRDYTMGKDEYDKEVANLNAQTEVLQQEDKVLELRLNQIDTEQKELDTELAAVKEVLKKNIEGTFKTFA